jgi:cell surface hyaluronidase
VSFAAAQRGNAPSNNQTIEVLFDGTAIGTFSPSGTGYTAFTTSNITATAGAHALTFLGLNPKGGDNTAFIDDVVLSIANGVQDGSFESPNVGTGVSAFQYDPTGTPWTYTGPAGVAGNGSAFTSGNPSAPAGTQVAIIQQTGQINQSITLAAGTYSVSLAAAQRGSSPSNSQTIEVLVDSQVIGVFTPAGTSAAQCL